MRGEEVRFLAEIFLMGFVFVLFVTAVAVFLFGREQVPSDGITGKISTPGTIDVWLTEKKKVVTVDFEEYVCRVTAGEMPASFESEALKAQSVAARTYALAKIIKYEEKHPEAHPAAPVCDTTHCQVYKTENELIKRHEEGWEETGWEKIQKACKATEGQLLYYEGELVMQPLFFSSSGGMTENSEDVFVGAYPYLVSVESPYEEGATHREEEKNLEIGDFAEKLRKAYPSRELGDIRRETIKILSRTAGGRVAEMQVGTGADGILKGTEVRTALGLSSAMFTVSFREDEIVFISSGSGHGVGLSQYGADGMAKEGYDYKDILSHYYSGTEVG